LAPFDETVVAVEQVSMTGADLVRFLIDHDVVQPADVVGRGVRLVDRPRDRFIVREVSVAGRTIAFVKELRFEEARPYLDAELAALAYLERQPAISDIGPRRLASDASLGVVVMAPVEGDQLVHADDAASIDALAQLLGSLHRESRHSGIRASGQATSGGVPWVFKVLEANAAWRPPALAVVWPFVRDPVLIRQATRAASRLWVATSLVHGDIKWEHCFKTLAPDGTAELRVIDWELAGMGDPAWDVASALAELLLAAPPGASRASDAPGTIVPPVLGRFMHGYGKASGVVARNGSFAYRAALFTGLRMFQASLERATADPADASSITDLVRWAEAISAAPESLATGLQAGPG
jgi:hypothetical protein